MGHSNIALYSHAHRHEDRACHGYVVQGEQEEREEEYLGICFSTKSFHGLQHHGQEIQEVVTGEHGQQLVEATSELRSCKDEDGGNVPQDTQDADHHLHHSL